MDLKTLLFTPALARGASEEKEYSFDGRKLHGIFSENFICLNILSKML